MASVSLLCGLLLIVGVKAYDPAHWFTNQTISEDFYLAQLDDLISVFLNFIDLETIADGRDTELARKMENIKLRPLTFDELSEATEGICHSFRERIINLSNESNLQSEYHRHLVTKLREAMAFFTRFDHLPPSVRDLKYALGHTVSPGDSKFTEYFFDDGDTEETIDYLSGVTEVEDLFDSGSLETSNETEDSESSVQDIVLEDRIGSIQDSEETLDKISIPGVPGQDFPNYEEIPTTAFSCEDKDYVPGFYADLDASCQVFHVCWPHHREIFLCPTGSTFNQEILSCDYWYNSNCSLSQSFYDTNAKYLPEDSISSCPHPIPRDDNNSESYINTLLLSSNGIKFFPVKFKTYNFPDGKRELDGTHNLFNWKLKKILKLKGKLKDGFADIVVQDKDWIRDFTAFFNVGKETLEKVSEQTTVESATSRVPLQLKLKLKSKKDLFESTSKLKNDRSGVEYSAETTKQDLAKPTTPVLETSTDSNLITETDLDFTTPTISEESLDSTPITEEDLGITTSPSLEEHTKFTPQTSTKESSSTTTTPVSKVSNTRKLKPLFPKLKGQKVVVGEEHTPAIVQHVLKAAINIVNDGILPLTKQMLAKSYSKHHKMKYCI